MRYGVFRRNGQDIGKTLQTVTPAQAGVHASERVVYAVMQNMFQTPRHGFQPSLERRSGVCYNHISKHKTVTPAQAGVYASERVICMVIENMFQTPRHGFQPSQERQSGEC